MNDTLHIDEIVKKSRQEFNRLNTLCEQIPDEVFFQQPPGDKWSIAQHVKHLVISTRTTTAAFALPKFLVRWVGGRPNRPSRNYDELVNKYKLKLQQGGKANGRYVPKKISASYGKDQLVVQWKKVTANYLTAVKNNWNDQLLDEYIVSHPLLGKITLRELCYFTMYHTYHHYSGIANL